MIGASEARLGRLTVRSSVITLHQQHRVGVKSAEVGEAAGKDVKGEKELDSSSSTDPTSGPSLDSSLGSSRGAQAPQDHLLPCATNNIVAVEPSFPSSLEEKEKENTDIDNNGNDEDDIGQTSARTPFGTSPQSQSNPSAFEKSVSFDAIEVREYTRILGDHPDTMMGPPITLSWEYCTPLTKPLGIEEYERERGERRSKTQLLAHPNVRRRWLREASMPVSENEMKRAEREVHRSALRRRNSAAFHPLTGPVEEAVQSIKRKVKRKSWRSNDNKWWEQYKGKDKV
mmetsp:Transcript_4928/g.8526  ORF Transcript_4928/g.8526 Transcript_4928/m.8526 type:complete len:286 (-) Transcript_4928:178-1035(-)|eukprot:CAMPEP_0197449912 /NCGR_PEP_ID=MMETSP1175-20131217/23307_1 /TAXON_ID=1003142 /ORGANISM="Triceratium dubium, Strain CCMP147" /LENGTH=285 /DNA_ID=CAMNT_0042982191 /DNA_START=76 /DNA_END=933 /DNA_ORIENTATION=+